MKLRPSEIALLVCIVPAVFALAIEAMDPMIARGHMPTPEGVIFALLELLGVSMLRFVLPAVGIVTLGLALARQRMDLRYGAVVSVDLLLALGHWMLFQFPER